MYMGYFGFAMTAEALFTRLSINIPLVMEADVLKNSGWLDMNNQFYVWVFVFAMAFWQAICGYTGTFELISWSMFLFPVVKVYNVLYGEPLSNEAKKIE